MNGLLAGISRSPVCWHIVGQTGNPADNGFRAGQWIVTTVTPGGEAADALRPGDRILAINEGSRAGRFGPRWSLLDLPPHAPYTLEVARGQQTQLVPLRLGARVVPHAPAWTILYLFVSLRLFSLATLIG